jgi:hypothetical protein
MSGRLVFSFSFMNDAKVNRIAPRASSNRAPPPNLNDPLNENSDS